MQSPLLPLPPLSVVQPAEPHSLPQPCPPQRGSEFTHPSHFHRRSGDLQNANANDSQLPRLETYRRFVNFRSSPICLSSRTAVPPSVLKLTAHPYQSLLPQMLWSRPTHHLTFLPKDPSNVFVNRATKTFLTCMYLYVHSQPRFSLDFTTSLFNLLLTFASTGACIVPSLRRLSCADIVYLIPIPLSAPGRSSDPIVNAYMFFPCFRKHSLVVMSPLLPNQALCVPIQAEYDLR